MLLPPIVIKELANRRYCEQVRICLSTPRKPYVLDSPYMTGFGGDSWRRKVGMATTPEIPALGWGEGS
jgi:hypothetical protein